eukprot:s90_g45.t1
MFMAAAHREMMVGPAATAQGYGVNVPAGAGSIDWKGLKERRDKYVAKLNTGYTAGWKKEGVEVIEGIGTFVDSETVAVQCNDGSSRTLKGKHILIACGGLPSEPDIPGVEHAINSDGFFELEEQPKKVAVVGAGYIAVEMAGILHAMGSETHLFFRGDTVLRRGFDPFLVETLMEAMEHHGPILHRNSTPASITKQENGLLTYTATEGPMGEQKSISDFDCILLAIGRKPVTDQIGLQNTSVALNKSGHIVVDKFENTNVPGIYAIGDVTLLQPRLVLLELLKVILTEWLQEKGGAKTLREAEHQNLIDPTEELGEEACGTVFSQLAMPGSTFRLAFSEPEQFTWNESVMMLKDILSEREADRASESGNGSSAPTVPSCSGTPVEGSGDDTTTSPSDDSVSPDGTGSAVDTMQTALMELKAPQIPRRAKARAKAKAKAKAKPTADPPGSSGCGRGRGRGRGRTGS